MRIQVIWTVNGIEWNRFWMSRGFSKVIIVNLNETVACWTKLTMNSFEIQPAHRSHSICFVMTEKKLLGCEFQNEKVVKFVYIYIPFEESLMQGNFYIINFTTILFPKYTLNWRYDAWNDVNKSYLMVCYSLALWYPNFCRLFKA